MLANYSKLELAAFVAAFGKVLKVGTKHPSVLCSTTAQMPELYKYAHLFRHLVCKICFGKLYLYDNDENRDILKQWIVLYNILFIQPLHILIPCTHRWPYQILTSGMRGVASAICAWSPNPNSYTGAAKERLH